MAHGSDMTDLYDLPSATTREHLALLGMARRVTTLDAGMMAYVALQVSAHALAAHQAAGWQSAYIVDAICIVFLVVLIVTVREARPLLWRLFIVGGIAGVCELFTDYAGQRIIPSLSYPAHEPFIWTSPAYMPIAWLVVLTPLGYLAWRAASLFGRRWAVPLTAIAGAILVPFYEEMAFRAGWWRYVPNHNIAHVPAYVILFEGLVVAVLPNLLRRMEQFSLRGLCIRGIIIGVWMPVAALLAWLTLGI